MCIKMSDVRLSNASPTLERVDARQQDNHRPSVRRNLYGRPDPLDIQRNLAAVEQEEVQAFRDRYNFDPVNEIPLSPRNYEWEVDSDPPEFYLRPHHGSQRPQREAQAAGDSQRPQREAQAAGDSQREDAAQRSERQPRKRPRRDSGPCSAECQPKRSHTEQDDDDDEEQPRGAGRSAAAHTHTGTRPESSAEVQ